MNKYIVFILLSLTFCSLHAQKEVEMTRGVWMWGSTLGSEDSKALVSTLKANYVNKVFLLIKGTAGTKTPASVLTEFITDAHNAGIQVHLWYIVAEDMLYVTSHPDAAVFHSPKPGVNNNPYIGSDSKVNLLYPGYKDYVLSNIKYFLENFNSDGIHLDVIRYSHLVYSFDTYQLAKAASMGCDTAKILNLFRNDYSNMSGNGFVSLYNSGDPDVVKWVTMRKNIIHDYISSIKDLINDIKPGIELSAAFMPEGAIDPGYADVYYAQSYSLNSPLLDEISPMAYFNSYGEPPSWLKTITSGAIKEVSSNCKITTGYQTFDGVTADQVKYQLQYSLEGNAYGAVNFRYGTTSDDQWAVIKDYYKKIYDMSPHPVTAEQMLEICGNVCASMSSSLKVPDSVYVDSTKSKFMSAADFYYLMADYLRYFSTKDSTLPASRAIYRNIAAPARIEGTQNPNQVMLGDIFTFAKRDADYIDSTMIMPDCVDADTVKYDPSSMFWVYARTLNWYKNNKSMPNYATVKVCSGPSSWTYGDNVVSVDNNDDKALSVNNYKLQQNYPNPFNPVTTIEFTIPETGMVSLKVFDILGREVSSLINNELTAGVHKLLFDASGMASGIYFYRLSAGTFSVIKKMTLLK
jgi:uncharacterized lipoprotein YddW (UPF0748 family)